MEHAGSGTPELSTQFCDQGGPREQVMKKTSIAAVWRGHDRVVV
jgi:hypothetical protein